MQTENCSTFFHKFVHLANFAYIGKQRSTFKSQNYVNCNKKVSNGSLEPFYINFKAASVSLLQQEQDQTLACKTCREGCEWRTKKIWFQSDSFVPQHVCVKS